MKLLKRFIVKKNERGLLFCEGDFVSILEPGVHKRFDLHNRLTVETFSLNTSLFEHRLAGYLRQSEPALVEQYFERMDLAENEAGLRFEDGALVELLAPGSRQLYWKGQSAQTLQRIDLSQTYRLDTSLVAQLNQPKLRGRSLAGLEAVLLSAVPAFHVGVLKVDGVVEELLGAGQYGFWRFNRQVSVELVDMRIQAMEISGQEILTRDKVSLRLNLAANWRYSDVLGAFAQLSKPLEHLYREVQFGLRAAVGTRTLDELLENKQLIDDSVSQYLQDKLIGSGIEVSGLGVRDIILPGEMKTLLAQVVEAEKAAQANVIRRREETSATRSLLNTAKVMEDNPTALRLKELETLERVAERIDRISVFGGLDQVLNGLVSIKAG
ncbi:MULTISPECIES: slipin family protein [Pseudomonas]|uniref:Slipin family protein n=1 Tax=Pseudomonas donghuensis TaxID=1163398 RepID=A0AAP0XBJ5_9PSED|nr:MULTISPECIES: slipin family protein [Pseudomonas]MDF9895550.1 regulator of protease activity HflC (stomatin/prohibitin superfamily) [Pseudomonas vranovensis]KDN97210.1 slipin family protein [Pseudomonas donghuensis]MBF4208630.1 slipin family protein [Pseudomonas donghuensis]MBS7597998.1 slipin family protein [Pseudomonas sp. RC2C2]MCP6692804.1 slipin family protein [Pseudomonas donghuensis]